MRSFVFAAGTLFSVVELVFHSRTLVYKYARRVSNGISTLKITGAMSSEKNVAAH